MSDDTDVVESLRAVAAWLYPPHPEPDPDDRAAVRAYWDRMDKAAEVVGDLAEWDADLLRRAVGEPLDDDEESPPGRAALASAAWRAEQLQEPLEASARRLAQSALLGATFADEHLWPGWVEMLATHDSRDRLAALALARDEVPFAALQTGDPDVVMERAQQMLDEALGRLA